jgi:hypothetical protein
MRFLRAGFVAAAIAVWGGSACGGNGDSNPSPAPSPGPSPQPSTNPCDSVPEQVAVVQQTESRVVDKRAGAWGDTHWSWIEHAWTHRTAAARRAPEGVVIQPRDRDAGEVTVIEDSGQLVLPANQFDLGGRGLRFRPNGNNGYDVTPGEGAFRSPLGNRLTLTDDDASQVDVPFSFTFYDRVQTDAFVNSDGNVTFGEGDTATTARNVTRLLGGPPRLAPFFADLDPSAGGSVWVNATPSAFTVTWCGVRGFGLQRSVTAQMTLIPDGTIDFEIDDSTNLVDAVVGVSPGKATQFSPVDLSTGSQGARGAVAERFTQNPELDVEATTERFYRAHPDSFDQLVIWTDVRVVTGAFAYETTVANAIRGLGISVFDESRSFGSAGRLASVVVMDALTKYPADPEQKFLGENDTLSLLGQESGHRWLVFLRFRDVNRRESDALLGRDKAHWGFFVDSDASVMEGNDIEDLGGGSFRTVGAVRRYSRTDMYAMGLVAERDVPPFFYVESPINARPSTTTNESAPRVGVTFNGTRRNVRLQDIMDVMGRRQPAAGSGPRLWRQAFVYVVGGGRQVDSSQVEKLDRIRREWEIFFGQAVGQRSRLEVRVR